MALTFGVVLALGACRPRDPGGEAAPSSIRVGVLASAAGEQARWAPFLADMRRETGLAIEAVFVADAEAQVEAIGDNRVQVGWFSNTAALQAVRRAEAEVFARAGDPAAPDGRVALIVAQTGPLDLDRLLACDRSLAFGVGAPESTAGAVAPMTYLFTPRNIDPETCFETLRSAGDEANLFAVASGVLDAAASDSAALRRLADEHPKVAGRMKVIWSSPRLPEDPVLWRKDLDPAAKEKLRSFLLTYGTQPGAEGARRRAVLASLAFDRFHPADSSHLLSIREMLAIQALLGARNAHDPRAAREAEKALEQIVADRAANGGPPRSEAAAP